MYNEEEHLEDTYYTLQGKGLLKEFIEKYPERKEKIDSRDGFGMLGRGLHGSDW